MAQRGYPSSHDGSCGSSTGGCQAAVPHTEDASNDKNAIVLLVFLHLHDFIFSAFLGKCAFLGQQATLPQVFFCVIAIFCQNLPQKKNLEQATLPDQEATLPDLNATLPDLCFMVVWRQAFLWHNRQFSLKKASFFQTGRNLRLLDPFRAKAEILNCWKIQVDAIKKPKLAGTRILSST